MVQPFYNAPPTADQVNPWNNLLGKALERYNAMTMSKYLPQQQEADIFHKKISPLANIAVSPVFSLLNPQAQQKITNYISQGLGGQNQQQHNRSPIEALKILLGGQNPQQPMQTQQQIPSTSYGQNLSEKFNARQAAPGSTIVSPEGNPVSSIPTAATTEGTQATLTAYEELEPRIQALAKMAKDFPGDLWTKAKIAYDKGLGGPLADSYEKFQSLKREIKPYMKKLNWTDADIDRELKVKPNEKDYGGRLLGLLHRLEESAQRSKKREGGISLQSPSSSKANKISSQINLQKMSTEELQRILAEMK